MIELDASHGEGGGQLVRTAVALAALTGKRLRVANVRAGRPRPGLAAQHLAALRAVAGLCDARCEGLELRSSAFTFEPRSAPAAGELRVDVGTAGSVTLVLQALLPILFAARAPSRVVVTGGTDVRQAPSWDYFDRVLLPLLARMGLRTRASVARRGYYPGGGGEVTVEVQPGAPQSLSFSAREDSWRLAGEAHVANLPLSIAERMREAALAAAGRELAVRARLLGRDEAIGTGGAITLWAQGDAGLLGASRIAERGVRAETLGQAAGAELAADLASGANLDVHAADQVLVYLAMSQAASSFAARAVSSHASTAMWLLPQFLPVRFTVERQGALWRVSCSGQDGRRTRRHTGRAVQAPAWNVVVTTESGRPRFLSALAGLRRLGEFWTVPFKGVCVGRVDDAPAFLEALREAKARDERWAQAIARAIPVEQAFAFTPETLGEQLKSAVAPLAARIPAGRFHFRFERRGLAGKVRSNLIEQEVADYLFSLAAARGVALHTSFSDPDTVLVAETVGEECGVALLPRALRERYPFVATR